jgi:O-antigen/teichoic acid export membrane protein
MRALPHHLKVAISNWVCRGVTVAVQLLTIPLLVSSLGTDSYAAYAIVLSMLSWFALTEFGTGSAIRNYCAEARGRGSTAEGEIGTVALILLITLVVGTIVLALSARSLASFLLAAIPSVAGSATLVVFTAGVLFLMTTIGLVANKLLYGLGRGVTANVMVAAASLMSLATLWLATRVVSGESLLLPAVVAYGGPPALLGVVAAVVLCLRHGSWDAAKLRAAASPMLHRSARFFVVAVFAAGVLNVDYIVMSQTLAPEQIVTYNLLARCFNIVLTLYAGLLAATSVYWSERIAQSDWSTVLKGWRQYIVGGAIVVVLITLIGMFAAQPAIDWMLPDSHVTIEHSMILLFGLYMVIRVWTDASTVALQAANETGVLIRWIPVQAVISIAGQTLLARHFAANGILLGLILSFLATVAWALPTRLRQLARARPSP